MDKCFVFRELESFVIFWKLITGFLTDFAKDYLEVDFERWLLFCGSKIG